MLEKITDRGNKYFEYVLVFIQFAGIILIALMTHFGSLFLTAIFTAMFGIVLGGYSILVMKLGNFHVLPRPVSNSILVKRGPYRYIRHPMYTSVLMIAAALIAGDFTVLKLLTGFLLAVCLIVKLYYEENLLMKRFPEYEAYRKTTKRLIPFVW